MIKNESKKKMAIALIQHYGFDLAHASEYVDVESRQVKQWLFELYQTPDSFFAPQERAVCSLSVCKRFL